MLHLPPSYNEYDILYAIIHSFLWIATPEPADFWSKCHKDWVAFYENYKLKHNEPKNK